MHRAPPRPARDYAGMVLPFELATEAGVLAFFSTITVFGTPIDVTLSELALECFYPADAPTAEILHRAATSRSGARHDLPRAAIVPDAELSPTVTRMT